MGSDVAGFSEGLDTIKNRVNKKSFIVLRRYSGLFKFFFVLLTFLILPVFMLLLNHQHDTHQNVYAVSSQLVYYGAYVANAPNTFSVLTGFEADAQKPVAIDMWYQQWGATDGTQYFQTTWMNNVRNHGSIPMVSWEPWNAQAGTTQPAYSLQKIINGNFDSYITRWANDSKVWGHPYFLRFAAEMNGNWFPWCEQVNNNKPGDYANAWKHVHAFFVKNGVTNVTWVWSPNIEYTGSTALARLYPGNRYVDWTGMDGYNWGTSQSGKTWQTFSQVFQQTYNDILQLSAKPLVVAETASTESGGNKTAWITDAYQTQLPTFFPHIKAIIWFNQNKETDWRIESSSAAQTAFAASVASSYFTSNSYANLNQSPIPPADALLSPGSVIAQDTFQRPNQTYWGTASDGHSWGAGANTSKVFSIVSNAGKVSNGSGIFNAVLGSTVTDAEVLFSGFISRYSTTNLGAVLRWTDSNNWYRASINGMTLVLQKRVSGATTTIGSASFAATAGKSYTLRFRVVGTTLFARVWQTGTTEPTGWQITVTDTSLSSGYCGLRLQLASGVTATYTSFLATVPGGLSTPTPTATPSPTPSPSPTVTPSPTPSSSPSPTATVTISPSPTPGLNLAQDTFHRPNQAH